ncbi:MAG: hypothetical protein ACPG5O_11730 [Pseudoalteromonas tetraodonis]
MAAATIPAAGDDYAVYFSATAPADDAAAKVSTNYTKVALADSVSLDSAGEETVVRFFGGTVTKYGANTITGAITLKVGTVSDDGAEALATAEAASPKPLGYYLITTGNEGAPAFYGSCYVGGTTFNAQAGPDAPTESFALGVVTKARFTTA